VDRLQRLLQQRIHRAVLDELAAHLHDDRNVLHGHRADLDAGHAGAAGPEGFHRHLTRRLAVNVEFGGIRQNARLECRVGELAQLKITSRGLSGAPTARAGQASWQRPHLVQASRFSSCFQVKSVILATPGSFWNPGCAQAAARRADREPSGIPRGKDVLDLGERNQRDERERDQSVKPPEAVAQHAAARRRKPCTAQAPAQSARRPATTSAYPRHRGAPAARPAARPRAGIR
jgi:hypothetical protein